MSSNSEEKVSIIQGTSCSNLWMLIILFSPVPVESRVAFKNQPWWPKETLNSLNIWTIALPNADLTVITTGHLLLQHQQLSLSPLRLTIS